MSCRYLLAFLPFALVLLISTSYQKNPGVVAFQGNYYSPEIRNSVKEFLYSENLLFMDSADRFCLDMVKRLYAANHFAPLWTNHGIDEKGNELMDLVAHAREYGLEPENYDIGEINARLNQITSQSPNKKLLPFDPKLEVMLSRSALKLMINLHSGYRNYDSSLFAEQWIINLPDELLKGVYDGDLYETILSAEPQYISYQNLRKATQLFVRSRTLNNEIKEIRYPVKDTLLLMDEIKEALLSLGYLTTGEQQNVNKALQQFQVYHGLHADGKPGINTIEALRKSTLYRYRVLALNLDRMRKRAQSDSSMLNVNIPAYRLTVFDGKKMTGTFKVIVGNPSTPTPLISGDLQMIIANPVWYVPKKIAINEMLPKIKEDSLYLKRNGFQLLDRNYKVVDASKVDMSEKGFDYTFRQNRGSDNSLGQIKFLFSNPDAIYLHDTPGKQLFEKDIRAFSHGCIRVQNPEALAEEILTRMKSDTASFRQTLKTGQEREFKVTIPLRVQITYITCEADADGKIYFYKDIYGLDDKELLALGI